MPKITDIFFDLDHTLWDFDRNSALTYQFLFDKYGINLDFERFRESYESINLHYWRLYRNDEIGKAELRYGRLKDTFDVLEHGISDELILELGHDYIKHLPDNNYLFPDVHSTLTYLKERYRLHIITNGFDEIQDSKLRKSEIIDYFDLIMTSEMAACKKPNPIIFNKCMEILDLKTENCLMIGDSAEADIEGALGVGMDAILFDPHNKNDTDRYTVINNIIELQDML